MTEMIKRKSAVKPALSNTSSCGCPNTRGRSTSRVNSMPVQAALHNRSHPAYRPASAVKAYATAMSSSQTDTTSIPESKEAMQCEFGHT